MNDDQGSDCDTGHACLALYSGVVESIARAFGSSCEVVLHSLEDVGRSVVKIENSHVTGRSVGAPMTDLGLQLLDKVAEGGGDVIGPYFTRSGKNVLRSVSLILRDLSGKPIGFLCINLDLSAPFLDIARGLLPEPAAAPAGLPVTVRTEEEPIEHFASSVKDLVRQALQAASLPFGSERTRRAVEEFWRKGIFRIKGSVEIAAEELGVSRHTVYYYLRDLRGKTEGEDPSDCD
jgi:predicted transcriptional regulator YheO